MGLDERKKRIADFRNQLTNLEQLMNPEGPYALGSRPCLADCVIFPTVHMLLYTAPLALGWDEADFFGPNANLEKWYRSLLESPGFKETAEAQTVWHSGIFTAERLGKIRTQLEGQ